MYLQLDIDLDEMEELRYEDINTRKFNAHRLRHSDPRDPEYIENSETEQEETDASVL